MALITLRDVSLSFRGPPVLDRANLALEPGERVCLLGRNGTGKTTLLRLIHGEIEVPRGEIARQQGLRTAMLPQEVPQGLAGTVFDEVARGVGSAAELLAEYHHVAHQLAAECTAELQAQLDRVQHALELQGGWSMHQQVEAILSRMSLEPDANLAELSAGMKRRVLLARALVHSPDVLLLDEPTNHLDMIAIGWLEEFFLRYAGTILFVTHDRALLRRLATRIIELDRGRLTSWACDYDDVPGTQRGIAGGRGAAVCRVRQEAGQGRSLDPHGHPGSANAKRRPRSGVATTAAHPPSAA